MTAKKTGCLLAAILAFILWFVIGVGLYKAMLLIPPKADDEDAKPFEIIPSSDD